MAKDKYELEDDNLFKYATKELSQDAFLCWLISWYNDNNKKNQLYTVAEKFLNKILEKSKKNWDLSQYKIEIKKQYKKIDILVNLLNKENEKIEKCIIIEDKINTKEHDNQIKEYKKKLESKYKKIIDSENYITVYYKMIDYDEKQENNADVKITIDDMLNIFKNTQNIKNDIFQNYKNYLENRKNILDDYENIPFSKWNKNREIYWKYLNDYKNTYNNKEGKLHLSKDVTILNRTVYILILTILRLKD